MVFAIPCCTAKCLTINSLEPTFIALVNFFLSFILFFLLSFFGQFLSFFLSQLWSVSRYQHDNDEGRAGTRCMLASKTWAPASLLQHATPSILDVLNPLQLSILAGRLTSCEAVNSLKAGSMSLLCLPPPSSRGACAYEVFPGSLLN